MVRRAVPRSIAALAQVLTCRAAACAIVSLLFVLFGPTCSKRSTRLRHRRPIAPRRVALPAACALNGLLALLRQLHSGRPWLEFVWVRKWQALTEAAQLAVVLARDHAGVEARRLRCGQRAGRAFHTAPEAHCYRDTGNGIMWVDRDHTLRP